MKKNKQENNKCRNGSALVATQIILGIILISALSIALVMIRQKKASLILNKTNVAYQVSDEGAEKILNLILKEIKSADYDPGGGNIIKVNTVISRLVGTYGMICKADGTLSGTLEDGSVFSATLKDSSGVTISCSSPADISGVYKVTVVGSDPQNRSQRSVEAVVSQNDSSIKLLLHMDGPDGQAGPFYDASRIHSPVTNYGVKYSVASLPEGYFQIINNYSVARFDGSSHLFLTDSPAWDIGSDFSIRMHVNFDSFASQQTILDMADDSNYGALRIAWLGSSGSSPNTLRITVNRLAYDFSWNGYASGRWYQIFVVKKNDTLKAYVSSAAEGNKELATSSSFNDDSIAAVQQGVTAGAYCSSSTSGDCNSFSDHFQGYMDEIIIRSPS